MAPLENSLCQNGTRLFWTRMVSSDPKSHDFALATMKNLVCCHITIQHNKPALNVVFLVNSIRPFLLVGSGSLRGINLAAACPSQF